MRETNPEYIRKRRMESVQSEQLKRWGNNNHLFMENYQPLLAHFRKGIFARSLAADPTACYEIFLRVTGNSKKRADDIQDFVSFVVHFSLLCLGRFLRNEKDRSSRGGFSGNSLGSIFLPRCLPALPTQRFIRGFTVSYPLLNIK